MSTTTQPDCCPECGCADLIGAARGLTCTTCGLVVDETETFVVRDQMGKNGVVSTHAILHANTTTLVGTAGERSSDGARRLSRTQKRTVTYGSAKESRVYHLASAAVANSQLPEIVVDHAVHAARKIAALAPKGSSMAGPAMVAALSVFVACKKLGIHRPRDDMLAVAASIGVDGKLYMRNLLRLKAITKRSRRGSAADGSAAINAALSALRDVIGPGDWLAQVTLVHGRIARALVGLRGDSAAAVTAYLAAQLITPAGVPLTILAKALRFRPASLYNAVKRVLRKIGIVVEGPMSKARVGAVLRSRMSVGGGVVTEAPVSMSAPAIASPEQAAIPVKAKRPAIPAIPAVPAVPAVIASVPKAAIRPIRASRRSKHERRGAPLHVQLLPFILEFSTPHGRALRSVRSLAKAERRARSKLPAWFGSAGPPAACATGPGPPVPVA